MAEMPPEFTEQLRQVRHNLVVAFMAEKVPVEQWRQALIDCCFYEMVEHLQHGGFDWDGEEE